MKQVKGCEDSQLLEKSEYFEAELLEISNKAIKSMLRVLYSNQFV